MEDPSSSGAPWTVRTWSALSCWWRPTGSLPAPGARPRVPPPQCLECGAATVQIEITESPSGGHFRYQGTVDCGNGQGDPMASERAQAILDALTPACESARIQAAGLYDDFGFCTACTKFYCPTHWEVSSTGGGTCPAGHFKSLDPHWHPDWDEL